MTILHNLEKRKRGRPRKTEVKKVDKKLNSLNIINSVIEKTNLDIKSVFVHLPINTSILEKQNDSVFMDSILLGRKEFCMKIYILNIERKPWHKL